MGRAAELHKITIFLTPNVWGFMVQFDAHIFQGVGGSLNHQLVKFDGYSSWP